MFLFESNWFYFGLYDKNLLDQLHLHNTDILTPHLICLYYQGIYLACRLFIIKSALSGTLPYTNSQVVRSQCSFRSI